MTSGTRTEVASSDICDASTAGENGFKDRLGLMEGVTRRTSREMDDLRRY